MDGYAEQLGAIVEDFNTLENEIKRGFTGEIPLSQIMERSGYWDELRVVEQRLQMLTARIRDRLAQLMPTIGSHAADAVKSEVEELTSLQGQLQAVWERLQTFVSLIEQKELAQQGVVSRAVTHVKAWLATLGAWIKRISGQLWQLLCRLMTPKEWKLSGEIGTGPFGLAKTGIEITFG